MSLTFDHALSPSIHPAVEALPEHAHAWLSRFIDVHASAIAPQLARARIHELAARTAPDLDLPALHTLHGWYLWLFLNDDGSDPLETGHDPDRIRAHHAPMLRVLDGHPTSDDDPPLARMLDDLLRRCGERGRPGLPRLIADTRAYLEANQWEALLRHHDRAPSLATYTHLRHDAGAAQTAFDLFPLLDDRFFAAPRALRHPLFRALEILTNQHISWVNDILGFEREQAEGHHSNVVAVLSADGTDVGSAIADAVDRCNALMLSIMEAQRDWQTLEQGADDGADQLVRMMVRWTRGSLDWHLRARRYLEGQTFDIAAPARVDAPLDIRPELLALRRASIHRETRTAQRP